MTAQSVVLSCFFTFNNKHVIPEGYHPARGFTPQLYHQGAAPQLGTLVPRKQRYVTVLLLLLLFLLRNKLPSGLRVNCFMLLCICHDVLSCTYICPSEHWSDGLNVLVLTLDHVVVNRFFFLLLCWFSSVLHLNESILWFFFCDVTLRVLCVYIVQGHVDLGGGSGEGVCRSPQGESLFWGPRFILELGFE